MNMGGLVNDPAFKTISPLWAKNAGAAGGSEPSSASAANQTKNSMSEQEMATLQARLRDTEQENAALKAKQASADQAAQLAAKQAEIEALTNRVTQFESAAKEAAKAAAKAGIADAVKAGKIQAQAVELQAKLVEAAAQHPVVLEILSALPANAALRPVIGAGGGAAPSNGAPTPSDEFIAAVHAEMEARKISKAEALDEVIARQPELYRRWRDSGQTATL